MLRETTPKEGKPDVIFPQGEKKNPKPTKNFLPTGSNNTC